MDQKRTYPQEFLDLLASVKGKRARTVIDHILKHGSITTTDLKDTYGYDHPPRAIRDVKEAGIPVVKTMETCDGVRRARYTFGNPDDAGKFSHRTGRSRIEVAVKNRLVDLYGEIDFLYLTPVPKNELQVDHRIPYEINGDGDEDEGDNRFMLLSASANRLKSHACENCPNWTKRDPQMCRECFWAYPEHYSHIGGKPERIAMVVLKSDEDIAKWDKIRKEIGDEGAIAFLIDAIRSY